MTDEPFEFNVDLPHERWRPYPIALMPHWLSKDGVMPRHVFDVRDGAGFHPDRFGDDSDSFADARQQCRTLLPDIAREERPDGERLDLSCDARDDARRVICRGESTYRGTQV